MLRPDIIFWLVVIIAIVCYSPIGKAIALRISRSGDKQFKDMDEKYQLLANKFKDYEIELNRLRESVIFYQDKAKIDENKKFNQD